MNLTVRESVRALQPVYGGLTDAEVIGEIRTGRSVGEALFYLLFGRYQDMLRSLFAQEATAAMEFSDFMLSLNMRLFDHGHAAIMRFDGKKASFKTYLSKIARNLLYDLRKEERPSIDCSAEMLDPAVDDGIRMMQLVDAINSCADRDARYVLFKVIEGYKSKGIAEMLSSRRHEEGTLDANETLKASYIDTVRSRALRKIRMDILESEAAAESKCRGVRYRESLGVRISKSIYSAEPTGSGGIDDMLPVLCSFDVAPCESGIRENAAPACVASGMGSLFMDNLRGLLRAVFC